MHHQYVDETATETAISTAADQCYIPANNILLSLAKTYPEQFRISFSISGVTLELLEHYRPDVLDSFKALAETGCIDFVAETYYHSLSALYSKIEFCRQVQQHTEAIEKFFQIRPIVFRNTELIHNNELAKLVAGMGYRGMLCEGIDRILQERTANQVYAAPENGDFGLLLRNARLSDDIAFRFDDAQWNEFPLTAQKFAEWLHTHPADTEVINLFMDYETFGIHKKPASGIFNFLQELPEAVLKNDSFRFSTPAAVLQDTCPKAIYDTPQTISWEDKSKACCVWTENVMQHNTLKKIYSIASIVLNSNDEQLADTWRKLQAADYFYYMADDSCRLEAWKYQNPYHSPKEAHHYYTNIITDLEIRLIRAELKKVKSHRPVSILY